MSSIVQEYDPAVVFVSYSSVDRDAAEAVCAPLESRGLQCWMAPRDILPGDEWSSSIVDALQACAALVVVFSKHANSSLQVRRENLLRLAT